MPLLQVAIADEDGRELGMSKAAGQMGALERHGVGTPGRKDEERGKTKTWEKDGERELKRMRMNEGRWGKRIFPKRMTHGRKMEKENAGERKE